MKLLIDEMWTHAAGRALRDRGFDVECVSERDDLRSASDLELLEVGRTESRVIVTENATDFRELVDIELSRGRDHAGLLYTSPITFFRGDPRSIGRLVLSLERLLAEDPDMTNRELWLRPPDA